MWLKSFFQTLQLWFNLKTLEFQNPYEKNMHLQSNKQEGGEQSFLNLQNT